MSKICIDYQILVSGPNGSRRTLHFHEPAPEGWSGWTDDQRGDYLDAREEEVSFDVLVTEGVIGCPGLDDVPPAAHAALDHAIEADPRTPFERAVDGDPRYVFELDDLGGPIVGPVS